MQTLLEKGHMRLHLHLVLEWVIQWRFNDADLALGRAREMPCDVRSD